MTFKTLGKGGHLKIQILTNRMIVFTEVAGVLGRHELLMFTIWRLWWGTAGVLLMLQRQIFKTWILVSLKALPFYLIILSFGLSRAAPAAYGGSLVRGLIRATAACLHHSHHNAGSEPHLRPTPQLKATLDPWPAERGQGPNPQPHGSSWDLFPLRHDGNSQDLSSNFHHQWPTDLKQTNSTFYAVVYFLVNEWSSCCWNSASVHGHWIESQRQSFGWSRKEELYCFARQRGRSRLVPSKLCPALEQVLRRRTVSKGQGVTGSRTFFWLAADEVIESQHHKPPASSRSGLCVLVGSRAASTC